jgi:colicin import membrane protein
MNTATLGMFEERIDQGKLVSFMLAALVHLLLLAILLFGVRWQNRPPESIAVELWEPPPAPAQLEPAPAPKPEPVPEPVVEKPEPVVPKPEIVEKKAPPKPKLLPKVEPKPVPKVEPKPVPKAAPKPVPKAEPFKPRVDDSQRRMREELAREQAALAIDRERQNMREQAARDSAAASNKSMADWVNKVRAKIRGNVTLPPDVKGNPEAIFDVVQLPTGEVISVRLRRSSGQPALDNAIERAILKSSPLPRPDRAETAPRAFELKYRPLD